MENVKTSGESRTAETHLQCIVTDFELESGINALLPCKKGNKLQPNDLQYVSKATA